MCNDNLPLRCIRVRQSLINREELQNLTKYVFKDLKSGTHAAYKTLNVFEFYLVHEQLGLTD